MRTRSAAEDWTCPLLHQGLLLASISDFHSARRGGEGHILVVYLTDMLMELGDQHRWRVKDQSKRRSVRMKSVIMRFTRTLLLSNLARQQGRSDSQLWNHAHPSCQRPMQRLQSILIFPGLHHHSASFTDKEAGHKLWRKQEAAASSFSKKATHRRKPGRRSYWELWAMAAPKEISVGGAVVAVLPKLDDIFTSEEELKTSLKAFLGGWRGFTLLPTGFGKILVKNHST